MCTGDGCSISARVSEVLGGVYCCVLLVIRSLELIIRESQVGIRLSSLCFRLDVAMFLAIIMNELINIWIILI